MTFSLNACDIERSFADDSPGLAQQRLLGVDGVPHLGKGAWDLGVVAYRLLCRLTRAHLTSADVSLIAERSSEAILMILRTPLIQDLVISPSELYPSEPRSAQPYPVSDFAKDPHTWPWRYRTYFLAQALLAREFNRHRLFEALGKSMLVAVLAYIDTAVFSDVNGDTDKASDALIRAGWLFSQVEFGIQFVREYHLEERTQVAARASEMAKAKHRNDPKQAAKRFVRDCWESWKLEPARYASTAAFARDMLDKATELRSQQVVERWCRHWATSSQATHSAGTVLTLPAE